MLYCLYGTDNGFLRGGQFILTSNNKGGESMTVFEALMLMLTFGTLIVMLTKKK
ncbi:putative holin-like toxin [Brevibacillus formosus]|uniref:Holin-like toxin n=1 Tax=Brevibacillus formosus TaxID=54913 RepID=A0ABQ0T794_9BACL|nr:putative holin-like toxin [Brevibacillus formosus]MED1956886.1 putative holin-like toxin [Brevibacillus formosus]GED59195.1 hypothetical protein BFO01nite_33270 [Brevibacillus formosus]